MPVEETCKHEEIIEGVNPSYDVARRLEYVENAEVGTLVAFNTPNGKVKSAMVENKSTKNRKLKLVTSYGVEYIVSYEDVVWVKTGTRWPRGVYRLLKGLTDDNERGNQA